MTSIRRRICGACGIMFNYYPHKQRILYDGLDFSNHRKIIRYIPKCCPLCERPADKDYAFRLAAGFMLMQTGVLK